MNRNVKQRIGFVASFIFLALFGTLIFNSPAMAYSWTFDLIPLNGALSGAPGETLTWGYTIANNESVESGNWLDLWLVESFPWLHGEPVDPSPFDFPLINPGTSVTGSLYSFTWYDDAPIGFINSGEFTVMGDWYDADPYNSGGQLKNDVIFDDTVRTAAYSATVVPEPSTLLLLCTGLLGLAGARRKYA